MCMCKAAGGGTKESHGLQDKLSGFHRAKTTIPEERSCPALLWLLEEAREEEHRNSSSPVFSEAIRYINWEHSTELENIIMLGKI